MSAERQWLTAVMAVQLGLADPRKVLAAMSRWTVDREGEVAARLETEGVIDGDRRRMLEAMVAQAVSASDGHAGQVLESLGGAQAVSRSLGLDASVLHLSQAPAGQMASAQVQPTRPSEGPSLLTREQAGRYRMEPDDEEGETVRAGPDWHLLRAYDAFLGRGIVLKEYTGSMNDGSLRDSGPACRFVREARITGQLEHPNIVPVYEVGQRVDGRPYFTMRSIPGRSLGEALSTCRDLSGRLDLLRHYLGLCQAVAYSHDHGVVVRSLDPQHVLLGPFGETVVLEWGRAKVRPGSIDLLDTISPEKNDSDKGLATESLQPSIYMSPEQAVGDMAAVDERSDVWTLGAILYELLSGRPPFDSAEEVGPMAEGSMRRNCHGAPAELLSICQRAMQSQLEDRYATAKELVADVQAYLTGRRVSAHSYGVREFLGRFGRRHRWALRLALFAILFFMLAGAGSYLRLMMQRNRAQDDHQSERARRADANLEAVRTDVLLHDFIKARAKLRTAAEIKDSPKFRGLWSSLERRTLRWVQDLGTEINSVDLSDDGRWIAAGGHNGTIFIMRFDGALVRSFRGHDDRVTSVVFAPGGGRLWSSSLDGSLREWDMDSGLQLRQLQVAGQGLRELVLDPRMRWVAAAGEKGTIYQWRMDGDQPSMALHAHTGRVDALAIDPDGKRMASAGLDGQLLIWDMDSGDKLKSCRKSAKRILDLAFSRDGALILAAEQRGRVSFFGSDDLEWRYDVQVDQNYLWALAMDPIRDRFAAGSHRVGLFDLRSRIREGDLPRQKHLVSDLVFGKEGRVLVTGTFGGRVRFFDLEQQGIRSPQRHRGAVVCVDYSPDGRQLATVGRDATLRLWNAENGVEENVLYGHEGAVWSVRYGPRSRFLATGGMDGTVRIWPRQGEGRRVLHGHAASVLQVAFSPKGDRLASASADKTVRIWDVESGKCLAVLEGHGDQVCGVDFDPKGRWLATAGWDKTIRLWDAKTYVSLKVLGGLAAPVYDLAFGPEGRWLASVGRQGVIRLWDLRTGQGRVLGKYPRRVRSIDFSPDGAWVASAGQDGFVRLWPVKDENSGQGVAFRAHDRSSNALRFSPDGRYLASCGEDGTLRKWEMPGGRSAWWVGGLVQMGEKLHILRRQTPILSSAWAQAARQSRDAWQTGDGLSLCLARDDGHAEIWDLETDQLRLREFFPGLRQVVACRQGCVALAQGRVHVMEEGGVGPVVAEGVDRLCVDEQGLSALAGEYLLRMDEVGKVWRRRHLGPGVRIVIHLGESLIMGFRDGNIERLEADGERFLFANPPSASVTILMAGPTGTFFAGYGDGSLRQWTGEGAFLDSVTIHGAVRCLKMRGDTLVAVSEIGDRATWDLGIFSRSYCDLMAEIWRAVPFVWSDGHLMRSGPPAEHVCLRKGALRP